MGLSPTQRPRSSSTFSNSSNTSLTINDWIHSTSCPIPQKERLDDKRKKKKSTTLEQTETLWQSFDEGAVLTGSSNASSPRHSPFTTSPTQSPLQLPTSSSNLSLASLMLLPTSVQLKESGDIDSAPMTPTTVSSASSSSTASKSKYWPGSSATPTRDTSRPHADFSSMFAPFAACPNVSSDGQCFSVPSVLHTFFVEQDTEAFDSLLQELHPYPFRQRQPVRQRLERKQEYYESPSLPVSLRSKRHSFDYAQIDHYDRTSSIDEIDTLKDIPYTHALVTDNYEELVLRDRIQWITQQEYQAHSMESTFSPGPQSNEFLFSPRSPPR
ncbi:hypothetical protein DM01DRAFT_322740 [Hesseltinella vesiculosa]|uniref:Uncharacterized protein n=1 Tax=Hesseltinella vesiculosa TaxID=101127 RepID=A0A1X2GJ50_9FUNG|nr:hypothetical protein DM01DRAFT_322740 [Hesseltinella vesiculosa]